MENIIDKSNLIPLYLQLADWIENEIIEQRYKIGSKIPSEGELANNFQLNRNTIRHAISLLVQKGYLEKQKGVGTFVKRKSVLHPVHQLDRITSFVDDFDLNDVEIEDKLISKKRIKASSELAKKLTIGKNDDVVQIERVRIADKTPYLLERHHYAFKDFGALIDMEIKGSLYQILTNRFNADLNRSIQTIRAVKPTKRIAQKLDISIEIPCIFIESFAYTADDVCIEVLQSYYRGDRYLFRVEAGQYRRGMSSSEVH